MFKWLARQFSQAEEDPTSLGSDKGLDNFIAALPVTVPLRRLEAIGEPFENAAALGLAPERLRRALKRLDERAQEPLQALWAQLFEDTRGRNVSDAVWLVLARFHRNVHAGYEVCLDALQARDALTEDERSDAVLMACRAMCALGRFKALTRMRYRDVDARYWKRLHDLAARSAQWGGATTLIELYPGSGYVSSVEREYLIALVYDAAPIANLLPAQLIALDPLLRRFATHFQLAPAYRDSAPFSFDPAREPGVRRSLKGLPARPGQRFFGVGGAHGQLAALRRQSGSEVPEWLAHARLDVEAYRHLLDLLLQHWASEPPQRRHRRDRSEGEVLVTRGVAQVRRMLAASEYVKSGGRLGYDDSNPYEHKLFGKMRFGSVAAQEAAAPDRDAATTLEAMQKFELEGDRQMTERWTLNDVSASGLGAQAAAHGGWARVGMLIGFRRADSLDWQLAAIRRLSRSTEGRFSVGAQRIEGETLCARVRFGSGDEGNPWVAVAGSGDIYHDAILLRGADGERILLEPGVFTGAQECMLSYQRVWHRVRLEASLEQGYDYELVRITPLPAS